MSRPIAYPSPTASTQADTEAPAGVSVSLLSAIPAGAACRDPRLREVEWTPAVEEIIVPDLIAEACAGCPVRGACLAWAVRQREWGYWAGSTTVDRARIVADEDMVAAVDRIQRAHRSEEAAIRLHPDQEPSLRWYRRGCPCRGCSRVNTAHKRTYRLARQARLSVAASDHHDQRG